MHLLLAPSLGRHRTIVFKIWSRSTILSEGGKVQFLLQNLTVKPKLADRFGAVSLRQVDADEGAVSTLPQGLGGDGGQRRLQRPGVVPLGGQGLADALQRPQAELVEPLALDDEPIIVPIWQKVEAELPLV